MFNKINLIRIIQQNLVIPLVQQNLAIFIGKVDNLFFYLTKKHIFKLLVEICTINLTYLKDCI